MQLEKLLVVGVGLIGGSFALKLKQLSLVKEVVGFGRSLENLEKALELGVIDSYSTDIKSAAQAADLIVLAVPIASIADVYAEIKDVLKPSCIVTDVGSAKASVINSVREKLGYVPENFVAGHPIAGREKSGVTAVEAELFKNHRVILTPLENTNPQAVELVAKLWQATGALVSEMSAEFHDEVFAATSHLPHMLAFALVDLLQEQQHLGDIFQYTAGGFRDFTRIASSDPVMWRDIALHNKDALLKWLAAYQEELSKLSKSIAEQDADELFKLFSNAKNTREKHILSKE